MPKINDPFWQIVRAHVAARPRRGRAALSGAESSVLERASVLTAIAPPASSVRASVPFSRQPMGPDGVRFDPTALADAVDKAAVQSRAKRERLNRLGAAERGDHAGRLSRVLGLQAELAQPIAAPRARMHPGVQSDHDKFTQGMPRDLATHLGRM